MTKMNRVLSVIITCVILLTLTDTVKAAIVTVAAPTGTAATDIANINTAVSSSASGDTVRFQAGTYNTQGTTIVLNSDHRTYDCVTAGTCIVATNTNRVNFSVTTTRNTFTMTKLVLTGCGIELSGAGGGAGGGTAFVTGTITLNTFQTCQVVTGTFINENFRLSGFNINNNLFLDGGTCYQNDGTCDASFSAIHMYQMSNVTFHNNIFTHVERGIAQYFYPVDINTVPSQPGIRITNNTFTRLHARAIELQSCGVTGEVISGNYAHKWQNAFYGSWGFSMAQGFGDNSCTAVNTLIQNNLFDSTDSVLNDLVTLHTDTTLCMELSGINTTADKNVCKSLQNPEAGHPNYWTGWDQGIYSGMTRGTLSNNCFGGTFISNTAPFTSNNFYTFGDGGTPVNANLPSIINTLSFANPASCPNPIGSSPTITTTSFPNGVTSNVYSYTTAVSGGVGPYVWAITSGALPTGLSLNAATGVISGTPSGSGISFFTIRVTDNNSATNSLASSITITAATGVVSDPFAGTSLNTGLWTFVNPVGDGSQTVGGGHLSLVVPGAALHDPGFGNANNSVRVIQSITGNFTAIAKFDSIPSQQYQFQGIVVNQDSTNWMYFSVGSTGTTVEVDMNTQLAGANSNIGAATITPGASICLLLSQSGTSWTASYSSDCINYTVLTTFTQAFTTVSIGPYAANYNNSTPAAPAYTALVDYFVNGTVADMTLNMSHSGSFTQSQVGAAYTITASNGGGNPSNGLVTVSVNSPSGLIPVSIAGTGWGCVLNSLSCTRSDSLAASANYPDITYTVNVSANAGTPVVPSATVAGGGESNTSNDTVTNSTVVIPVVTTHAVVFNASGTSPGGVFPIITVTDTSGTVLATYTLTASAANYTYNTATLPTSNIRLNMTNGNNTTRIATITAFSVDGNSTPPTTPTVFTLSNSPNCHTGYLSSTILACSGYIEFPIVNTVPPIDTTSPSTPTGLTATALYAGGITLTWTASIDDVGVIGYRVFVNGVSVGVTTPVPAFVYTAGTRGVNYTFSVLAIDLASNVRTLSGTATISISSTGTVTNGGTTTLGTVDNSAATITVPFSVVSSEPLTGVTGQAIWNSRQSYPEFFLGGAGTFAIIPTIVAKDSWDNTITSIGGGGASPILICQALMCPAGTYEISYRMWTTITQPASTTVLSFSYNDGTAVRTDSSASLNNAALNVVRGTITVVTDGINPITYNTLQSGGAAYSGRIVINHVQ